MSIVISDNLFLRLVELSDIPCIFEIVQSERAYLRKWLPWVDLTQKIEDTERFVIGAIASNAAESSRIMAIISENKFVGLTGLNTVTAEDADIGYWLSQYAQGKGIMTQAVAAVVKDSFQRFPLSKCILSVEEGNDRSAHIPQKLHFKLISDIPKPTKLLDRNMNIFTYELTREEYEQYHTQ